MKKTTLMAIAIATAAAGGVFFGSTLVPPGRREADASAGCGCTTL